MTQDFIKKYLWDLDQLSDPHFFMNFALVDDTNRDAWNYDDGFRRFISSDLPTVLGTIKPIFLNSTKYQLEIYPYSYATIETPENQIFVDIDLERLNDKANTGVHRYDLMVDGLSMTLYLQSE